MSFEAFTYVLTLAILAIVGLVLLVALWHRGREPATQALDEGRFLDTLSSADASAAAGRDSLYAAAVAAKHLLEWEQAEGLLRRILADDDDGEAWLELGLVETYRGNYDQALTCFDRAEAIRSDLFESLTLHRAFAELKRGNLQRARELFEEIEVPLETKLRTDIGAGEPLFAEWFLQTAALWRSMGRHTDADWARDLGSSGCGDSRLPEIC